MRKVRAEVFNPASINSALFDAPEKKTPAVTKREILATTEASPPKQGSDDGLNYTR